MAQIRRRSSPLFCFSFFWLYMYCSTSWMIGGAFGATTDAQVKELRNNAGTLIDDCVHVQRADLEKCAKLETRGGDTGTTSGGPSVAALHAALSSASGPYKFNAMPIALPRDLDPKYQTLKRRAEALTTLIGELAPIKQAVS